MLPIINFVAGVTENDSTKMKRETKNKSDI